jgi:steroid delta-isomerase-like uncharacterized protein
MIEDIETSELTMIKPILVIGMLAGCFGLLSCTSKPANTPLSTQTDSQNMKVTEKNLKEILEAFNRHDLNAIMEFFSDDCSFDFPRGPEFYGQRFKGKAQVREALASRFKGIPDVHYGDDSHWISADGNKAVSDWTLTGTTTSGLSVKVRGCDLWEFRNGKVIRKDSYWKIVEPTTK